MATDILLNTETDGDLRIENGDIVVGDSRYQHVEGIMAASPGHYKFDPLAGAALDRFINDEVNTTELLRAVRLSVERDGFTVSELYIQADGKLKIDGNYN